MCFLSEANRLDGSQLLRMTYAPGYDGGAYYSHNGKMLCWRANRPQGSQLTDYVHMLELGLVQPVGMQLYYMSIDDPNSIQMIGPFNGTSFAPSFLPVIAFKFSRFLFFDCFLS